jgi:hypothetical protein
MSTSDMMGLHVREIPGDKKSDRSPMYQSFESRDLLLFATLPLEQTSVCLPRKLFSKTEYDLEDGNFLSQPGQQDFYVEYQWTGERYDAVSVMWNHQKYSIPDFRDVARQQVGELQHSMEQTATRHAYFAPNWKEWRTVVESGGYIPILERWADLRTNLDASLLQRRAEGDQTAQIIYRVPVHHLDRPKDSSLNMNYFAPVEVLVGEDPAQESSWIAYETYQSNRRACAVMPEPVRQAMMEWLGQIMDGLDVVFPVGSLFGDVLQFWPFFDPRIKIHEGIDVFKGFNPITKTFHYLGQLKGIPAVFKGRVAKIKLGGSTGDLMGVTVVFEHDIVDATGQYKFVTHLTHLAEDTVAMNVGDTVEAGQAVASLNEGYKRINRHAHVGMAWVPMDLPLGSLTWDILNPYCATTLFVNPLQGIPLESMTDDLDRPAFVFRARLAQAA